MDNVRCRIRKKAEQMWIRYGTDRWEPLWEECQSPQEFFFFLRFWHCFILRWGCIIHRSKYWQSCPFNLSIEWTRFSIDKRLKCSTNNWVEIIVMYSMTTRHKSLKNVKINKNRMCRKKKMKTFINERNGKTEEKKRLCLCFGNTTSKIAWIRMIVQNCGKYYWLTATIDIEVIRL